MKLENSVLSDPTLLVLASLAGGEKHGYAIMEDIQGFSGKRLGPGTLYGAITRLEERGWIMPVSPKGRRQPYSITRDGREELRRQLETMRRLVEVGSERLQTA